MYNLLTSDLQLYNKRKKRIRCTFDPFVFTILFLILCSILAFIIYTILILRPFIDNFNHLVHITIPSELQFYHDIIVQHNRSLSMFETQIVNNDTLIHTKDIIMNLEQLTTKINITSIQNNLNQIANTLNKILPH